MHVIISLSSVTLTPLGGYGSSGVSIQCTDMDNVSDLREIDSISINHTLGYGLTIGYPSWPAYPVTFYGQTANTPQWSIGGSAQTTIQFTPGTGKSTSCSFDIGQWWGDGFNWSTTSVTATFTLIDLGNNSTLGTTSCTGGYGSYPSNTMNLGTLAARDYSTKLNIDINFFLQPT